MQGNRMNAFIMVRERLLFRSSPDKERAGGVCRAKISFLHDFPPQTPLNSPLSGGKWANKRFPTPSGGFIQGPSKSNGIHAIALVKNAKRLHRKLFLLSLLPSCHRLFFLWQGARRAGEDAVSYGAKRHYPKERLRKAGI
jgi:hypothetical protein